MIETRKQMTVRELRRALKNVPYDTIIAFQGNEEDEDGEYLHTASTGHVFSAFKSGDSFVIDCAITDSEVQA